MNQETWSVGIMILIGKISKYFGKKVPNATEATTNPK